MPWWGWVLVSLLGAGVLAALSVLATIGWQLIKAIRDL